MTAEPAASPGSPTASGGLTLSNEFTTVVVEKVTTGNGERLRISAPRLGYRIDLDPMQLESLTWQTPETFSRFLETPFGPIGQEGTER